MLRAAVRLRWLPGLPGLVLAGFAQIASAGEPVLHPAAQCAAYWLGRDDFARRSTLLRTDPGDPARAAAYRAVAVRLNGGDTALIDAFLSRERSAMALVVEAASWGDRTSEGVQERLLDTCAAYAATQAETRHLP